MDRGRGRSTQIENRWKRGSGASPQASQDLKAIQVVQKLVRLAEFHPEKRARKVSLGEVGVEVLGAVILGGGFFKAPGFFQQADGCGRCGNSRRLNGISTLRLFEQAGGPGSGHGRPGPETAGVLESQNGVPGVTLDTAAEVCNGLVVIAESKANGGGAVSGPERRGPHLEHGPVMVQRVVEQRVGSSVFEL